MDGVYEEGALNHAQFLLIARNQPTSDQQTKKALCSREGEYSSALEKKLIPLHRPVDVGRKSQEGGKGRGGRWSWEGNYGHAEKKGC